MAWVAFAAGFMVGGFAGFLVFALLSIAADSDRRLESARARCDRHDQPTPCMACAQYGRIS